MSAVTKTEAVGGFSTPYGHNF